MMMRLFAGLTLLMSLSNPILAQSAEGLTGSSSPTFVVADVHSSAHTMYPNARSSFRGERYIMRQASMADLIASAYNVDTSNVAEGPSWLETDRFDILARTPPRTSPDTLKLMLRNLLAERFKLIVHTDSKSLPAVVLSTAKGAPKMSESDGTANPACTYIDPPPNPPAGSVPLYTFSCRNTTMAAFAQDLHDWAGDYLTSPVIDTTGLKGAYDFDIKFHSKQRAARAGADGITIFDAVDKQLGLKLEAKTAPLPVVIVDSVNRQPTPNSPDVQSKLPPLPPVEFDVATIRPSAPGGQMSGNISGSQATLRSGNLQFLITFAYDINDEMLVNAPKFVSSDRFDLVAKAAVDPTPGAPQIDTDDLRLMVRKLLAERFRLVAHMEDRPLDAYTLIAVNPKLKKADPTGRTGCKEGPGADGKDPRIATPILGRLLTCRNITMAEFAAQLADASEWVHPHPCARCHRDRREL